MLKKKEFNIRGLNRHLNAVQRCGKIQMIQIRKETNFYGLSSISIEFTYWCYKHIHTKLTSKFDRFFFSPSSQLNSLLKRHYLYKNKFLCL